MRWIGDRKAFGARGRSTQRTRIQLQDADSMKKLSFSSHLNAMTVPTGYYSTSNASKCLVERREQSQFGRQEEGNRRKGAVASQEQATMQGISSLDTQPEPNHIRHACNGRRMQRIHPTEKGRKGWKGRFLIAPTPFFGRSSWCGRFGTLPVAPVSSPRHPRPLQTSLTR